MDATLLALAVNPLLAYLTGATGALYNTESINYGNHSRASWAFLSSFFGSAASAATASDSFKMDLVGPGWVFPGAHSAAVPVFARMLSENSGPSSGEVSDLFYLDRMNSADIWKLNRFSVDGTTGAWSEGFGSYEGILRAILTDDNQWTVDSLTYRDQEDQHTVLANSATPSLLGDYNNNAIVDAADYVLWRGKLGQSVMLPNDASPGTVTQADYNVWRANFGKTLVGTSAIAAKSSAIFDAPATMTTVAVADEPGGKLHKQSAISRPVFRAGILSALDSKAPPNALRKTTPLPRSTFVTSEDDLLATLVAVHSSEVQSAVAPTGDNGAPATVGGHLATRVETIDLAIDELGSNLSRGKWEVS
jgi:hypothetical protein